MSGSLSNPRLISANTQYFASPARLVHMSSARSPIRGGTSAGHGIAVVHRLIRLGRGDPHAARKQVVVCRIGDQIGHRATHRRLAVGDDRRNIQVQVERDRAGLHRPGQTS